VLLKNIEKPSCKTLQKNKPWKCNQKILCQYDLADKFCYRSIIFMKPMHLTHQCQDIKLTSIVLIFITKKTTTKI